MKTCRGDPVVALWNTSELFAKILRAPVKRVYEKVVGKQAKRWYPHL